MTETTTQPTVEAAATEPTQAAAPPPAAQPATGEPTPVPAGKVHLDLDALDRDGTQPGPFVFTLSGQRFVLDDPRDIDWQDLIIAQRNPLMFIKFTMGDEQYKSFLALRVPEWKMERLMVEFWKHFGVTDSPEVRALLG